VMGVTHNVPQRCLGVNSGACTIMTYFPDEAVWLVMGG